MLLRRLATLPASMAKRLRQPFVLSIPWLCRSFLELGSIIFFSAAFVRRKQAKHDRQELRNSFSFHRKLWKHLAKVWLQRRGERKRLARIKRCEPSRRCAQVARRNPRKSVRSVGIRSVQSGWLAGNQMAPSTVQRPGKTNKTVLALPSPKAKPRLLAF
jgi:hypothetical protein